MSPGAPVWQQRQGPLALLAPARSGPPEVWVEPAPPEAAEVWVGRQAAPEHSRRAAAVPEAWEAQRLEDPAATRWAAPGALAPAVEVLGALAVEVLGALALAVAVLEVLGALAVAAQAAQALAVLAQAGQAAQAAKRVGQVARPHSEFRSARLR